MTFECVNQYHEHDENSYHMYNALEKCHGSFSFTEADELIVVYNCCNHKGFMSL